MMKMSNNHYIRLKDLVTRGIVSANVKAERFDSGFSTVAEIYRKRMIVNADKVKDINKRFRWDMFARAMSADNYQLQYELYDYLNDDHIDTALKQIVPNIE